MLARFLRDRGGNVLPIFAITAVPLIVATGAVVDYTNAFDQRTVVQDSMDAAALAAGKQIGIMDTEEEIQARADEFFLANVQPSKVTNVPELDTQISAGTVDINTTLHVPTYFLGLIGLDEFVFNLHSQVTVGMGTLEVALVLDNSTSMTMPSSKIDTLRTAANSLVATLYDLGATSTQPDPVKVALAPFGASVNVGSDQTAWIDTAGNGTYAGDAAIGEGAASSYNPYTYFSTLQTSGGTPITWGGCVEERPMPFDVQDDAPSVSVSPTTEEAKTLFVPMFAPDEPDNWTCSTSNGCAFADTSNSTRRYVGAPTGSQTYNNYLPDANGGTCASPLTTFTVNSATPALFTRNSHGLSAGTQIYLNTTNSLYSGLTKGQAYYVAPGTATNTFRLTSQASGINATNSGSTTVTFTVTKANPAVFTRNSHGLTAGTAIRLSTTNDMYNPLTNGSTYYVISSGLSTNSFRVSTTSGGSAVNTGSGGTQAGTHSYLREGLWTKSSHGLSVGDGIVLTTGGTLPGGYSVNTLYYVRTVPSSSTFTLATTSGGSPIFPTSAGSGTHSYYELIATSGSQSGTHSYSTLAQTATWTCQSGDADCGGTNYGQSEEHALAGINISASPQCKYGTAGTKGTVSSITVSSMPGGPNFMCTTSAVTPLTVDEATITTKITALQAVGYTNITAGIMWGWRLLSPGIPFTQGRAYDSGENQKIMIVMTDGENTYLPHTDKDSNPSTSNTAAGKFTKSMYGAWGYIYKNHVGTTAIDTSDVFDELNERTALACVNAKAEGIKVYTVAFQVSDVDTVNMLTTCATEPDMAFNAANNAALLAAFTAIGDDISLLRIAQ